MSFILPSQQGRKQHLASAKGNDSILVMMVGQVFHFVRIGPVLKLLLLLRQEGCHWASDAATTYLIFSRDGTGYETEVLFT